jgi:putative flippase GtrA
MRSAVKRVRKVVSLVSQALNEIGLGRMVSGRLSKFLIVGGVSYLVNQAVLFFVYEPARRHITATPVGAFDTGLLLASLVALEISIVVRFELNDRWTFAGLSRTSHSQRFIRANAGSIGGPMISLAAVNLLTPFLGMNYLVANSFGIALGTVWNWYWSTRVVWRRSQSQL